MLQNGRDRQQDSPSSTLALRAAQISHSSSSMAERVTLARPYVEQRPPPDPGEPKVQPEPDRFSVFPPNLARLPSSGGEAESDPVAHLTVGSSSRGEPAATRSAMVAVAVEAKGVCVRW